MVNKNKRKSAIPVKSIIFYLLVIFSVFFILQEKDKREAEKLLQEKKIMSEKLSSSVTPTVYQLLKVTPVRKTTPTPKIIKKTPQPTSFPDPKEWGKSVQIDEHTWTMKVGEDERMATTREIFEALNNYRELKGKNRLDWDNRLASYAQERAEYFFKIKNIDGHKGFMEYTNDIENVKKLGFWALGENSSFGYQLLGVHLIEWVYAGDEPHDNNQLDNWSHVGIGVKGTGTDLVFGTSRM